MKSEESPWDRLTLLMKRARAATVPTKPSGASLSPLPLLPGPAWSYVQAAGIWHPRGKAMERKGEVPTLKRVAQGKEGREQWA